tara:strand:- start:788068 stop:789294 length:1227 start_codon:yes stop_codon:yes gene_type:complete
MKKISSLFIVLCVLCACKNEKKTLVDAPVMVHTVDLPASTNSAEPFLFSGDTAILSWIENENDSIYSLKYAKLNGEKWDSIKTITQGTDWFVNWADFPAIAENNGNILSHFLQRSADGTYTYDIQLKLFNINDDTWSKDFILHTDGTKSEHGFVTMLPYQEDSFFVTWLDGRNTSGGEDHGGHGGGAMTIRAAEVKLDVSIVNEVELDSKTCDCCQTSAAITSNGGIVVYRDRSDDELRDIYITRLKDSVWTKPVAIYNDNWKISGCPVNGPKAVAIENTLAVSWFTNANETPKVQVIFSNNGGESFKKPITVDEGVPIGRVDVAMIDQENVLVSWVTVDNSKTVVKVVKAHISGKLGTPVIVTELDPSRASGFPQLEVVNNRAYVAWTGISENKTQVKTAYITLEDF